MIQFREKYIDKYDEKIKVVIKPDKVWFIKYYVDKNVYIEISKQEMQDILAGMDFEKEWITIK